MDALDQGATIRGLREGQRVFHRFVLRRFVGRGGMAQVWAAQDEHLGDIVALKFLHDYDATNRASINDLKKEVRRTRELTHLHIVRVNDFHQDTLLTAISMELIDGDTLANLRIDEPGEVFTPARLAPWVQQLCEALDYAHRVAGIVHRDLKPSNLMVDGKGRLKVADFGVARRLTDSLSRPAGNFSAGTLSYMSPQQLLGGAASPADDIYSVGATLYELMSGRPPFVGGALVEQVKNVMPEPLARTDRSGGMWESPVARRWSAVVQDCLAKDPGQRPPSARDLWHRLVESDRPMELPPVQEVLPMQQARRYRVAALGIAGAVALAVLGGIWWRADGHAPGSPVAVAHREVELPTGNVTPAPPGEMVAPVSSEPTGARLALTVDTVGSRRSYRLGEEIRLRLMVNEDCHVAVVLESAEGERMLLFPNQWNFETKIQAGRQIEIPGPNHGGFRWLAAPPVGHEQLWVIAARRPGALHTWATRNLPGAAAAGPFLPVPRGIRIESAAASEDPTGPVVAGLVWTITN